MNYEYCNGFTHTIKKGDTLYEISRKYDVPLALLLRANPYVDVFNLQTGDTICIPTEKSQMTPFFQHTMPQKEMCMDCTEKSEKKNANYNKEESNNGLMAKESMAGESTIKETMAGESMTKESMVKESKGEERRTKAGNTGVDNSEETVWTKYVVLPGDTLADIAEQMEGSIDEFIGKNGMAGIYMLPGTAYYIRRKK
ncbi:MAG: LysM domain-containing protein [Butyribacter sp.]|nr:LysM domain-containing protein [Butyribacter sp.]